MVTFHTKGHPTFVSDATTKDVLETISVLLNSPLEATANLGDAQYILIAMIENRNTYSISFCIVEVDFMRLHELRKSAIRSG